MSEYTGVTYITIRQIKETDYNRIVFKFNMRHHYIFMRDLAQHLRGIIPL